MARKKPKPVPKSLAYVIWSYPDHAIVDDVVFDTRDEAEDYIEDGLRQEDFLAQDVVVCELVERCQPKALITEVEWKEIK